MLATGDRKADSGPLTQQAVATRHRPQGTHLSKEPAASLKSTRSKLPTPRSSFVQSTVKSVGIRTPTVSRPPYLYTLVFDSLVAQLLQIPSQFAHGGIEYALSPWMEAVACILERFIVEEEEPFLCQWNQPRMPLAFFVAISKF